MPLHLPPLPGSKTAPDTERQGLTRPDVMQATVDVIAGSAAFGTDREVTTYNDHLKVRHAMSQLRRPPTIHPDSASLAKASTPDRQAIFDIPVRAPRPRASLYCAQPRLDAKRRVAISRIAAACGWTGGTRVTASIDGDRVRIRTATTESSGILVRVDASHRLTLTPALCVALGVAPGDAVQVVADLDTGAVTLVSLTRALELIVRGGDSA